MRKIKLNDSFGYCIIPKNTLLYRTSKDKEFHDCMFFALKKCMVSVKGNPSGDVQVWKTTKKIQVVFMVSELDERSWTTSAIPETFNLLFPKEKNRSYRDLDIKHFNRELRDKFVKKLYEEYGASGWLSSIEDKIELEVCLFGKEQNSEQLELTETVSRKNKTYFTDSLKRIRIIPSEKFIRKTNEKINQRVPLHLKGQNHFKRYRKTQNSWIKDEAKNEQEKKELRHFYFNLRMKLKV